MRNRNDRNLKVLLKELPYYYMTESIGSVHGAFNNSLRNRNKKTRKTLDKIKCIYDLDIFKLNTGLDDNVINMQNKQIVSNYYSPHSFEQWTNKNSKALEKDDTFSIFHNNVRSLCRNLEHLETHLLNELDFKFDVVGVTETKINNSSPLLFNPNISGYNFEYVPTPLASGGVGLYIDKTINYDILEKTSTVAFQALWIEISFTKKKNIKETTVE